MVDIATLTGACMIALGNAMAGCAAATWRGRPSSLRACASPTPRQHPDLGPYLT